MLSAVMLLAAALLLPASAHADSPFCSQRTMVIVAHQDDDLLFQSPDLLEAIGDGGCVRTVFVTAGDAGLGTTYWHEREAGSRAAYALMAGVPDTWSNSEETFAGHNLHVATLAGDPGLSEVYMRLPNGGRTGTGYAATGFVSLPKLWRSHNPQPANLTPINELSALDGSATYTYEGLVGTLKALVLDYEPDVILTQDFAEEFNATDHDDHIVTARFAKLADGSYPSEHVLRSYMDYGTAEEPVNVFEPQLARKTQAFNAYRAHDSQICISESECRSPDPDYDEWLKRQVVLSERAVPGADAGPNQAVASKAAVALNGSRSSDPLGHTLSYTWAQTGGPAVSLSNSHAVKPTFTAPTGPATLTFSLVVSSSEASSRPDAVTVSVAAPNYVLEVTKSGNGSGTVTSSPAGISCGADCEQSYESGKSIALTASPAAGSEFKGWSGACGGTGSCVISMSAAESVDAEFALQRHQLSVTKSGTGFGTVTSSPAGINCPTDCEESYEQGTKVTLSPTPAAGSEFKGWSGACSGTGACEVTMSAARSVGAEFALQRHQLSVSKNGAGSGSVISSPAGINCGATCAANFDHGTLVKLRADPDPESNPAVWESCPGNVNASNECEVTMSAAEEVVAFFSPLEHNPLTVAKSGSGSGTVTSTPAGIDCGSQCAADFPEGTRVTLTGAPGANSEPVAWEACPGTVNPTNQCEVPMGQARSATARFDLEQHALTVTTDGPGAGTVTSAPAKIDCGSDCVAPFDHGAVVTLFATADLGETVAWSGCDEVLDGGGCRVAMDADRQVAATFIPAPLPSTPPSIPAPPATPEPTPASLNPPNTKLLKAKIGRHMARFVLEARGSATRFRCAIAQLHRKLAYKGCTSPVTYRHLSPGRYVFKAKAAGPGGADPKPITRRFRLSNPLAT